MLKFVQLTMNGDYWLAIEERCDWLSSSEKGNGCKLRNTLISQAEVHVKCTQIDLAVLCVDAYNALFKGQQSIDENDTDAFLWLSESANQFENLQETDNALMVIVKGIEFAIKNSLFDKGYEFFRYGRSMFEAGKERGDPSLTSPSVMQTLLKAGESLVNAARKIKEGSDVTDMQAEFKVAILGGVNLKKAEKEEVPDIVIVDGRSLYEKKTKEYKDGAEKYLSGGMIANAVTFACMAALSELMLGRPKEGLVYLTKFASDSGRNEEFHDNPCFILTKQVFTALVKRDSAAMDQANVQFLKVPWSFKDDKEFARRVMDSVQRRLSS